uniref:hypothetical protein n=1 Tax=Anemia phyllitidis TaxID=12940 RepID=UPI0021ABFC8D|nr:hypothetical protein NYI27_pgp003 [Anemia phyllitidis]UUL71052.1 hypothetical protein [Anemia phyllitidis]
MNAVSIILRMFLYYPAFILSFYIYAVFIIPLKGNIIRSGKTYYRLINSFLDKYDVKFSLTKITWTKKRH